jgi:uncharacterized protein YndB with AHSA1/START domain/DNA-binding transcriptional ArsR family regulator
MLNYWAGCAKPLRVPGRVGQPLSLNQNSLLTCDHLVTYNTSMEQEHVFKALADPSRRLLLDMLFQQDGLSLTELCAHLSMTRFGVMKHLQILEEAGLVTTRKVGREKFHYLNPIPIQLVYDRWVRKYAQPLAASLTDLKYALEAHPMTAKPRHVFEIYIRATPERVWQAITDGSLTAQYYFGTSVASTWKQGAPYQYKTPDGGDMIRGEILEIDPPKRLVQSFKALWMEGAEANPASRVTWEIEAAGAASKLTLIHDELDPSGPEMEGLFHGWSQILSGMKTLLETGEPLAIG